ncbi:hypothetical protein BHM03_00002989 [Ensete ventricosum]|nr:hypothetical protein BHM03_00002989 [Ensete ventricosum]
MDSVSGESGYCSTTGIYRSPLVPAPPLELPCVSLPHFLLLSTPAPPNKPAFVDAVSGDSLSYAELHSLASAAASALSFAGLRRGDLALLVSPNSIHYPVLALAVLSLGAVLSTANPLLTHLELQTQVRDSEPVLIIAAVELVPKLRGLLPGRPLIPIEPFLASLPRQADPPLPDVAVGPGDPATVMYSSGTTGKSKGVVSTHGNLTATASLLRRVWGGEARRDEVYACVLPLSHMFGFSVLVCGTLASGATTVVLRRYAVGELLTAVEQHRVTRLPAVPPVVVQMARSCSAGLAGGRGLRSLKEVICSGAPIAREHLERFVACFPGTTVSQVKSHVLFALLLCRPSILVCQAPTYSKKLEKDQIDHFALRDLYAYICSMVKIESQESTYAKPSPQLYPDEEAGEIPVACVVRKAGSKVEEDDIFTFMENKVEGETFF